jgi:DNA mismatch repair protein MutS2
MWVALVQSSLRDFLELQHYSVDMLLAVVVTAAVWGWARRVYPECAPLPRRAEGAPADAPNPAVLALIAFTLVTAAVAILVAKA